LKKRNKKSKFRGGECPPAPLCIRPCLKRKPKLKEVESGQALNIFIGVS